MSNLPIITTSERSSFKRCPQQWWWSYREGLIRPDSLSKALWFGIGIHESLAAYYQSGLKRDEHFIGKWEEYCDNDELSRRMRIDEFGETEWISARELGILMLTGYREKYDGDKHAYILAIEEPFQLEIPDPSDPTQSVGILNSTFDGVYRDERDGAIKLWEHKTAASITSDHLAMDDQGGTYWMAASYVLREKGILGKGERIQEITYNFLRKGSPDKRSKNADGLCLNKDGSVSKVQPSPLFQRFSIYRNKNEQKQQLDRLGKELEVINRFRSGDLATYKSPRNDNCRACPFRDMCELHERGDAWEELKESLYVSVDPYARYRKAS